MVIEEVLVHIGLVVATAAKLALVFLMLGIFLFAIFATAPG